MKRFASTILIGVILGELLLSSQNASRVLAESRHTPRAVAKRSLPDKELPRLKLSANEKAKLKRIIIPFIDQMFRDGKVVEALEQNLRFTPLSPIEAKAVDEIAGRGVYQSKDWAKFLTAHKDTETIARAFAISLEYEEYLATLLWVGTVPLPKSEFCVHYYEADSAIEGERSRILAAHGISEKDFYNMLGRETLDDVNTLESINSELIKFIKQKTDKRIFEDNLALMKTKLSVEKHRSGSLVIYVVYFAPIYQAIFVREGGQMKMIAFGDIADSC
jgi:hypothetical protein